MKTDGSEITGTFILVYLGMCSNCDCATHAISIEAWAQLHGFWKHSWSNLWLDPYIYDQYIQQVKDSKYLILLFILIL
jgi:hypothetical protein